MSRARHVAGRFVVGAFVVVVVGALAGCSAPTTVFYEVTTSRTEECAIRVNGEFCVEPEQFDPPVATVWTVEFPHEAERPARLYVDEEVWVLDPIDEGKDPYASSHTASRSSIVTSGNGCTSTKSEALQFTADRTNFTGTLSTSTVLTGPAACGDTPVGQRTENDLAGASVTADGVAVGP